MRMFLLENLNHLAISVVQAREVSKPGDLNFVLALSFIRSVWTLLG
jgi:hypothetical protein